MPGLHYIMNNDLNGLVELAYAKDEPSELRKISRGLYLKHQEQLTVRAPKKHYVDITMKVLAAQTHILVPAPDYEIKPGKLRHKALNNLLNTVKDKKTVDALGVRGYPIVLKQTLHQLKYIQAHSNQASSYTETVDHELHRLISDKELSRFISLDTIDELGFFEDDKLTGHLGIVQQYADSGSEATKKSLIEKLDVVLKQQKQDYLQHVEKLFDTGEETQPPNLHMIKRLQQTRDKLQLT